MPKLVVDISVYQASDLAFFETLKRHGVDSVIVKLTEATNYLNSKAAAQIANAYKVFGTVGIYHFFHGNGIDEARYFLAHAKKFGLDKSTVMALDVEWQGLPSNTTPEVNAFLKYLKEHGYTNVTTYGSSSWFNYGRIHRAALIDKTIWVAAYGTSEPGVVDANAWQYTDNFQGLRVDASHDYDGSLSGKREAITVKPTYYNFSGNALFEVVTDTLPLYRKRKFEKTDKRKAEFTKGTRFYASAIKFGKITRLKTKMGYASANTEYVKKVS